ncbi:MAG TPA: hypothetical protein PKW90_16920, partial [Myxococcota bacterium]|nr:hypothetical protein [Myxococcota bacterium]
MLLLWACTAPSPSTPVEDTAADVDCCKATVPEWDVAEVQASVDRLLANGLPEPRGPVQAFQRLIDSQSQECPGRQGYNIEAYFGCVSREGWYWSGITVLSEMDQEQFIFVGDFFAVDPQGYSWVGAGDLGVMSHSGEQSWFVHGTWGYPPGGGWMQQQSSTYLEYTAKGDMFLLQGAFGIGEDAVDFEALRIDGGTLAGELRVRD